MVSDRATTRALALVIVGVLVFGAAAPAAAATRESGPSAGLAARYDGQSVLRGLAFGQGPVAERFSEFQGLRAPSPPELAVMELIIGDIGEHHPGFFDTFASDMQSGNRVRIRQAIVVASEALMSALRNLNAVASGVTITCTDILVFEIVLVALALAAVIVVVAGEAAVYLSRVFFAAAPAGASTLSRDQWVNRIALVLKA